MFMPLLRTLLVVMSVLLGAQAALAATWATTRDAAMTIREQGNPTEAYRMLASANPSAPLDYVDQQFTAGFIALRFLNRPDIAIEHFKEMAGSVNRLPKHEQSNWRSQAGYWMGRTLTQQGRQEDARLMYAAAAAYRDTFYGQMSASMLGLDNTGQVLQPYRPYYPDMEIFWHDPRVRKELVLAIIKGESSFQQTAQSPAGAKGLMQIMDGTAIATGSLAGVNIDLRQVATNGHYNVAVGSKIVGDLLQKYNGNILLMAAAYNAGPNKADEWVQRFGDPRTGAIDAVDFIELITFRETRFYTKKIVSNLIVYIGLGS